MQRPVVEGDVAISSPRQPLSASSAAQLRYHYVEFLTEHLSDCCRVFKGDLQEMLVLAVLGQVHVRASLDARPDGTVVPRALPGPLGIGASRIADITGIPRQTVRRKLDKLRIRGWVEERGAGIWVLAMHEGAAAARTTGVDSLQALDARSMERVLALGHKLSRIIAGT